MALKKEVIFTNGIVIKYHRINSIIQKNKEVKINISCYTDKKYREKEKINNKNKERYEELLKLIILENEKQAFERNISKVELWSEEANKIVNSFIEELDLSVVQIERTFTEISDLSMPNIYKLLKQDDFFIDSEDV